MSKIMSSTSWPHVGTAPAVRLQRGRLQLAGDLPVLAAAFLISYLLRFDFIIPREELTRGLLQLPFVLLLQIIVLSWVGVYSFVWQYIGMAELRAFMKASLATAVPLLFCRLWLPANLQWARVPLSIICIDTILAFGGVLWMRVAYRMRFERRRRSRSAEHAPAETLKKAVLLIGAGSAGALVAREIRARGHSDLLVKGFIDDDPNKGKSAIHGVKVIGTTQDLPRLVAELNIDHVIISFASAKRNQLKRVLAICERIPVKVRIIPGLYEIIQGDIQISRIRDVQIEDLLGREPIQLEEEIVNKFVTGKTVMVTGAGGSIGSELARQLARFGPARLLLVERSEPSLFNIDQELRQAHADLSIVSLVADVGDEHRLRSILSDNPTHIILHAAAHKHVPMMEFNPSEAIKNNVLATRLLGSLACEFGVESFVLISTDKAVRPTSVMGASKRVAELVVQNLNRCSKTRFVAVRFGNVIGSAGSVIPIFREQIRKGGPITVTHPDMTRYFMTIPEATQLVLQAGAMGEGGEIFILDMGEPVRILDLAKEVITLSGLKPFEDIDIVITGTRPGEKLFEELQTTDEHVAKTRHPKIYIGKIAAYAPEKIAQLTERLSLLTLQANPGELREYLNEVLPEARLEVFGNGNHLPGLSDTSEQAGYDTAKLRAQGAAA
jgi:FlaA1/EpsC-like NDP-sugar epimerase